MYYVTTWYESRRACISSTANIWLSWLQWLERQRQRWRCQYVICPNMYVVWTCIVCSEMGTDEDRWIRYISLDVTNITYCLLRVYIFLFKAGYKFCKLNVSETCFSYPWIKNNSSLIKSCAGISGRVKNIALLLISVRNKHSALYIKMFLSGMCTSQWNMYYQCNDKV